MLWGWVGAGLQLTAYGLLAARRLTARPPTLHILNISGGIGVGASSIAPAAWPSACLNGAWILIGITGVVSAVAHKHRARLAAASPVITQKGK